MSREFLEFWKKSCYYSLNETRQAGAFVQGRPYYLSSWSWTGSQWRTMHNFRLGPIWSLAFTLHCSFGGQCPASKSGRMPAGLWYLGTHQKRSPLCRSDWRFFRKLRGKFYIFLKIKFIILLENVAISF